MTEPYHTPEYTDENIPTRLRNILNTLAEYHTLLLQKSTLSTQDPENVNNTLPMMRAASYKIKDLIINPTTLQTDPILKKLQTYLLPWTADTTALATYWCELMFERYPFSISHNHINQLYRNSVDEEPDKTDKEVPTGQNSA